MELAARIRNRVLDRQPSVPPLGRERLTAPPLSRLSADDALLCSSSGVDRVDPPALPQVARAFHEVRGQRPQPMLPRLQRLHLVLRHQQQQLHDLPAPVVGWLALHAWHGEWCGPGSVSGSQQPLLPRRDRLRASRFGPSATKFLLVGQIPIAATTIGILEENCILDCLGRRSAGPVPAIHLTHGSDSHRYSRGVEPLSHRRPPLLSTSPFHADRDFPVLMLSPVAALRSEPPCPWEVVRMSHYTDR